MAPEEELLKVARARRIARSGEAKRIRRDAGVSARELGLAIGLSENAIFRWESGDRSPRGKAAVAWIDLLDKLAQLADAS